MEKRSPRQDTLQWLAFEVLRKDALEEHKVFRSKRQMSAGINALIEERGYPLNHVTPERVAGVMRSTRKMALQLNVIIVADREPVPDKKDKNGKMIPQTPIFIRRGWRFAGAGDQDLIEQESRVNQVFRNGNHKTAKTIAIVAIKEKLIEAGRVIVRRLSW